MGPPPESWPQFFHRSCPCVVSTSAPRVDTEEPTDSVSLASESVLTAHLLSFRFLAALCVIQCRHSDEVCISQTLWERCLPCPGELWCIVSWSTVAVFLAPPCILGSERELRLELAGPLACALGYLFRSTPSNLSGKCGRWVCRPCMGVPGSQTGGPGSHPLPIP